MNVSMKMRSFKNETPLLDEFVRLTSRPLFVLFENKLIEGHIHSNGYFYSSSVYSGAVTLMLVWNKEKASSYNSYVESKPLEFWCYQSDIEILG